MFFFKPYFRMITADDIHWNNIILISHVLQMMRRDWTNSSDFVTILYIQGYTLDNFIAGYTNTFNSAFNAPVRGAYPICGQYPGKAACGARLTVTCPSNMTKARYVIIQQPVDGGGYMMIVELEVSGYWTISRTNYYSSHNIYTFHICTAIS